MIGRSSTRTLVPSAGPLEPPTEISSVTQLAHLCPAFVRALGAEFDLAALSGRLCPVLFEDGSVAIFALADYVACDQIEEIERMVRQRGYARAFPARYVLPAPLLLTVSRGQLTRETLRTHLDRGTQEQASALAAVFMDVVRWGVREGASDIHLNVDTQREHSDIRFTIGGVYVAPACFHGMASCTLLEVLAVAWMSIRGGNGAVFDPSIEQQGRMRFNIDGHPIMLRWASLATDNGPSVCLRILQLDGVRADTSLTSLGYLPSQIALLERACEKEGGAMVLAGRVGSGKSTSLATLLRSLPPTRKIISLEDPVEYIIPNALQNTVSRSLDHTDGSSFNAKLRTLKRSAMNDLLLGEVRDNETGKAFMDLAGSGISVYTTTHTGAAFMIPERLASDFIGVSRDFLATPGVLKLLVYQALIPRLCHACALPFDSLYKQPKSTSGSGRCGQEWRTWGRYLAAVCQTDLLSLRVRNPAGCAACECVQLPALRGTHGRTVVAEMIEPDNHTDFLDFVRRRDNLGLLRLVKQMPRPPITNVDMTGKQVVHCAVYKAFAGEIDPRMIELHCGALETTLFSEPYYSGSLLRGHCYG